MAHNGRDPLNAADVIDDEELVYRDVADDSLVEVNATAIEDEVTGVIDADGTNALQGIDEMDAINQMANMDYDDTRKGMNQLLDTVDMQSTDGISNVDDLSSEDDVGYADNQLDSVTVRCPNCGHEFEVSSSTIAANREVKCDCCGYVFPAGDHVNEDNNN